MRTSIIAMTFGLGLLSARPARAGQHERPIVAFGPDDYNHSPLEHDGRWTFGGLGHSWTGHFEVLRVDGGAKVIELEGDRPSDENDLRIEKTDLTAKLVGADFEVDRQFGNDDVGVTQHSRVDAYIGANLQADGTTRNAGIHGLPGGSAGVFRGAKVECNSTLEGHYCGVTAQEKLNVQAGLGAGIYVGVPFTINWADMSVAISTPSPTLYAGGGGGATATAVISMKRLVEDPSYSVHCTGRQIERFAKGAVEAAAFFADRGAKRVLAFLGSEKAHFYVFPRFGAMGGTNVARAEDTLGADKSAAGGPSIAVGQTR